MQSGSCKVVADSTASTCCERGELKKEGSEVGLVVVVFVAPTETLRFYPMLKR